MVVKRTRTQKARSGFTLLEALVALVIFGIISVVLTLSLTTALQAQAGSEKRQDEAATVRAVFGALTQDVQSAYASLHNPASLFIAGGGSASGGQSANAQPVPKDALLALSTLTHRIQADDLDAAQNGGSIATNPIQVGNAQPQSDLSLVRYDFNPQTNTLTRTVLTTPNMQQFAQPPATAAPETVLAERVQSITLRFWDANNKNWRTDWDYEQQNQPPPQAPQTAQTGQGQTGQTGQTPQTPQAQSQQATGDTGLPYAVEVTIIILRTDGTPVTHTTLIPLLAPVTMTPSPSDVTAAQQAQQNAAGQGGGGMGGTGTGGMTLGGAGQ